MITAVLQKTITMIKISKSLHDILLPEIDAVLLESRRNANRDFERIQRYMNKLRYKQEWLISYAEALKRFQSEDRDGLCIYKYQIQERIDYCELAVRMVKEFLDDDVKEVHALELHTEEKLGADLVDYGRALSDIMRCSDEAAAYYKKEFPLYDDFVGEGMRDDEVWDEGLFA